MVGRAGRARLSPPGRAGHRAEGPHAMRWSAMKQNDITFDIKVNGRSHATTIDPRSLLIDTIRDLGATGARIGCLTGDCGACTVLLDGQLTKSCLVLALSAAGGAVTTIEG